LFQFICEKIVYPELLEVADLDVTERGDGGFGSTGTN
jgi:dUTP pyrophosphatase